LKQRGLGRLEGNCSREEGMYRTPRVGAKSCRCRAQQCWAKRRKGAPNILYLCLQWVIQLSTTVVQSVFRCFIEPLTPRSRSMPMTQSPHPCEQRRKRTPPCLSFSLDAFTPNSFLRRCSFPIRVGSTGNQAPCNDGSKQNPANGLCFWALPEGQRDLRPGEFGHYVLPRLGLEEGQIM